MSFGDKDDWLELNVMSEIEESSNPTVSIRHLENRSVSPNSTTEAQIQVNLGKMEAIRSMLQDHENVRIKASIDVEDNVGHYQIQYSDNVEL